MGAAANTACSPTSRTAAHDAAQLAARAQISERGAQTLLDGLVSIGLVTLERGRYRNTPAASAYLVAGRPPTCPRWPASSSP
ncbi:methyltransferase dimerization domain-containing protein, partial [Streptomyces venezuelae]|uniref:methyltransferase family protein n=1 Tax=Streptomyces venezuelae TaxID=54571 RepID=UPI002958D0BD